jgi:acyl-CoA synthetase (AMP-forming)/AMP-acid ligase II
VSFNIADLFEAAVDAFPEREYLVANGKRRTYAEMEDRANRLAHKLQGLGVGPGDHVGIYAYNSVEWVEALWAVFKLRAIWININYRYVEEELRYLMGNAGLKALIYAREFSDRVGTVLPDLPGLDHLIVIEDGSEEFDPRDGVLAYEEALASESPERDFEPRFDDDLYILYTGGTTGMPKGVVWRHKDVVYALGGGVDPTTNTRIQEPEEFVAKGHAMTLTHFPIAPLMHGATQWSVMGRSFCGDRIVLVDKFDPHTIWKLVETERANSVMITGDAMGKPLIEALSDDDVSYDHSSLFAVVSSAAIFSAPVKDEFFKKFPSLFITDAIGSSESGNNGMTMVSKDNTTMKSGPTVTILGDTVVFDEDKNFVEPGSGVIGRIARCGDIPVGYLNDPVKTAETFFEVDGIRYVMPGDFATVEEDGSVTLLGRGSVVINSGGEKIFPEEVESAVRSHPDIYDAIVVGAADERWGQTVAAIVALRDDRTIDLAAVQEFCRNKVAGYKLPRRLFLVDTILRSPSGKPDYRWAADIVEHQTPVS